MSKYFVNDIISIKFKYFDNTENTYRVIRVTKTYYEIRSLDITSWQNERKALIKANADVDPQISLVKRDIGWAFRNL